MGKGAIGLRNLLVGRKPTLLSKTFTPKIRFFLVSVTTLLKMDKHVSNASNSFTSAWLQLLIESFSMNVRVVLIRALTLFSK